MSNALWTAKTGLEAQQTRLSVISNNISNVNTNGYKKSRAIFEDLLYQNYKQPGSASSNDTNFSSGIMLGTGVKLAANQKDFRQGNLINTNNNLNLAIEGRGFFQVQLPNGDMSYTRDGNFSFNGEGQIVNQSGYTVMPGITVPENTKEIRISKEGQVQAFVGANNEVVELGNIEISIFANPSGLLPMGQNLFMETVSSGPAIQGVANTESFGGIQQGFLEGSNVETVEEMVSMIEAQRGYELSSKAVSAADQMLKYLNQTL